MHPYLPHLLADIAAATRPEEAQRAPLLAAGFDPDDSLEAHFQDIDRLVRGDFDGPYQPTLGQYVGLHAEDFPPADQLSDEDMSAAAEAFHRMLESWNHSAAVPDGVPPTLEYGLLVELLAEPTFIHRAGIKCFDWCAGVPHGCRLAQYCPCIKIREEDAAPSIP